ncbi:MAG: ABC transporter permease [Gemmatimonadaceae bacterium]
MLWDQNANAAWSLQQLTVSSGAQGVASVGNLVSGNYFDVLGIKPAVGRFFTGEERTVPDAFPVAVISYEFWQRQFAGDSAIVGRQLLINGAKFNVVGIAPRQFAGLYPVIRTDVWLPLMMERQVRGGTEILTKAGTAWLELFGRVGPRVSIGAAQTEIAAITKERVANNGEPRTISVFTGTRLSKATGLPAEAMGAITGFFPVLLVVSGLVLLFASVNVASMLLARAVARRREIAVRIALGAGRARLIRQLLTESVVLFAFGGLGGTALAVYGTRLLQHIDLPVDIPMSLDFSPDLRVLAVTLVVALATGIAFGLAPALRGSRMEIATTLRNDSNAAGRGRSRLRNTLVIGQVAVSLLLLTVSGLFVRALDKGRRVDIGFDVASVSTAALSLSTAGYNARRPP